MKAPGVNTSGPAGVNTGLLRASRVGCTWRPTRAKRQSQTGSSALSLPPLPLLLEVVEPKHKVLGEPRAHVDQVHLRLQTQKHTGGKKKDGGLVDAVHLPPLRTAPLARADQIASCAAERTQRARWLRLPPEGLGLRVRAPAGLLGYWATALPGYWAPGLLGHQAAPCMEYHSLQKKNPGRRIVASKITLA